MRGVDRYCVQTGALTREQSALPAQRSQRCRFFTISTRSERCRSQRCRSERSASHRRRRRKEDGRLFGNKGLPDGHAAHAPIGQVPGPDPRAAEQRSTATPDRASAPRRVVTTRRERLRRIRCSLGRRCIKRPRHGARGAGRRGQDAGVFDFSCGLCGARRGHGLRGHGGLLSGAALVASG